MLYPALTPQGIAGITVGAALRDRPRPAGVIFSALGAILILCPKGNFTRSDFRHGQASSPERGWWWSAGAGCELARKDCSGTSTPLLPKERKPVHAYFPIFSTVELERQKNLHDILRRRLIVKNYA